MKLNIVGLAITIAMTLLSIWLYNRFSGKNVAALGVKGAP